jgi:hypothetical protein
MRRAMPPLARLLAAGRAMIPRVFHGVVITGSRQTSSPVKLPHSLEWLGSNIERSNNQKENAWEGKDFVA